MKAVAVFILLLVSPLSIVVAAEPTESAKPFVLGARLDHVGVAVRDLDRARADYETLGFQVLAAGHFPGGASNAIIGLEDHFYLELITAPDDAKGEDATITQFAKAHEGAMYFGLSVSSAKDTAEGLKARNFNVEGPTPGSVMSERDTTPPPPQWYSVDPADKPAVGKRAIALPMFFIEYLPAPNDHRKPSDRSRQSNGVVGVRAIWVGVHDLIGALAAMSEQGFGAPGRSVSFDR
ncbi:MAG: VOC family protein, partial [Steroidobacteraceae bacterium]